MLSMIYCGFAVIMTASFAAAQDGAPAERFSFGESETNGSGLPSPAEVLGYKAGEQFSLYADVVRYLNELSSSSDRITLHEYGRTVEGRPLHYMAITSPENHARLDEIRAANLRLATGATLTNEEAARLAEGQPAIVWLSYNVHGNEASSTEAALQVAYYLGASQSAEVANWLRNTVVIVDPCLNPDGRDRYVYWYRSMYSLQLNDNAEDLEHDEPWPGGRTNHYWFDLNRDWVWLVHPESAGRIRAYQEWMPQVHLDLHEQGFDSNYFTMPGTTPRNLNLPAEYEKWTDTFGRAAIRRFDEHKISYATREAFDFFYPGYGSSYPSNMGAIGMLAEQGGHSRGGRAVKTTDGYVLTLRQRIFDHFNTSLATIETTATRRADLLSYFRQFFVSDPVQNRTYIFPDHGDSTYTYDVVNLLLSHGVEVYRSDAAFDMRDVHAYWSGSVGRRNFDAGTFIVSAAQPRSVFVNTLLQSDMAIEDSVMYDMAAWSAPIAYNLDAYWAPGAPTARLTRVEAPLHPQGSLTNGDAGYAFVIDWRQRFAPRALSELWQRGYRVRVARKPFEIEGHEFGRGALIVLLGRNLEKASSVAKDMEAIAVEAGVSVIGLDTGRSSKGIDLASRDSRPVKAPKVGLIVDRPISSYSAGQIWHLFDRETGYGISRIRLDNFARVRLKEYDVIILPGGGGLAARFDSTNVERLRQWIQAGGTFVTTESGVSAMTKDGVGLAPVSMVKEPEKKEEAEEDTSNPAAYTTYAAREDSLGLARIPGSALRATIDVTHPLAFGLSPHLYTLKQSTAAIEPAVGFHTVGHYVTDHRELLASGYASQKNLRRLSGKVFAGVQPLGSGRIVLFVDNTQYRMFWRGPSRMMQNAVLLLSAM